MDLVDAQQARRILDRLVGYNISPITLEKSEKRIECRPGSIGSSEMIIDREKEIKEFHSRRILDFDCAI